MAKSNKVTQARKAYVQSRAQATGKTTAADKAQFRQRFEKLASTKTGRAKIQEVTGISGIRKDLRSAYSAPKSKTTTSNTTNTATTSSLPGFGVAGKRTYTEAQTEAALKANPKSYNVFYQTNKTGSKTKTSSPIEGTNKGMSTTKKVVIGGGAAATLYGLSNRAVKLNQIQSQNAKFTQLGLNPYEAQAQLQGTGGRTTRSIAGVARGEITGMLGRWRAGGGLRRGSM